jgi:uncharacterized protein YqeY
LPKLQSMVANWGNCREIELMLLRDRLQTALKEAMKAKEAARLSTLRLINAAIKDREIAARGEADAGEVGEAEICRSWARW